ncbi:MAG TPA: transcription elongation factor GreA, partial [Cryomorphaceae bacterium]|nr:transcription elongation factor GreA [Cryomorphaceae bacterium]
MSLINYYTAEGLKKLREELDYMKSTERLSISNQIGEARDKGDLSENAEYDAAKEAQGMLEMKISKLEDALANARVLNEENIDLSKVGVLTKVKIKNALNGATVTYSLVAEKEADIKQNKISVSSPIGKGLLGKKIGEVAEIEVPR